MAASPPEVSSPPGMIWSRSEGGRQISLSASKLTTPERGAAGGGPGGGARDSIAALMLARWSKWCFGADGAHHAITVLIFACVFVVYFERSAFSIAFTELADDMNLTETEKGTVFAAFYYGYAVTQIPGGYLASRIGGKAVLTASFLLWAPASALMALPAGDSDNVVTGIAVCRLCIGIAQGLLLPAAHSVLGHWIPWTHRGRHFAFAMSGMYAGNAAAMVAIPTVVSKLGVSATFYIAACMGAMWAFLWACTGSNAPRAEAAEEGLVKQEKDERETQSSTAFEAEQVRPKSDTWAEAGMLFDSTPYVFHNIWQYESDLESPASSGCGERSPTLTVGDSTAASTCPATLATSPGSLEGDIEAGALSEGGGRDVADGCGSGGAWEGAAVARDTAISDDECGNYSKNGGCSVGTPTNAKLDEARAMAVRATVSEMYGTAAAAGAAANAQSGESRQGTALHTDDSARAGPGDTQSPGKTAPASLSSTPRPGKNAALAADDSDTDGASHVEEPGRSDSGGFSGISLERGAAKDSAESGRSAGIMGGWGSRWTLTRTGSRSNSDGSSGLSNQVAGGDKGREENAVGPTGGATTAAAREGRTAPKGITAGSTGTIPLVPEDRAKPAPVPWRAMSSSRAAWACVAGNVGSSTGVHVLMSWLPTYFEEFIRVDLEDIGLAAQLSPYLTMMVFCIIGGYLYSWLTNERGHSKTFSGKLITGGGFAWAVVVFLCMGLANSAATATLLTSLALASIAFSRGGWSTCHVEIAAPEHAAILFSAANTISAVTSVVGISVTGKVLDALGGVEDAVAWTVAMGSIGALCGACGIFYVAFAQGDKVLFPRIGGEPTEVETGDTPAGDLEKAWPRPFGWERGLSAVKPTERSVTAQNSAATIWDGDDVVRRGSG